MKQDSVVELRNKIAVTIEEAAILCSTSQHEIREKWLKHPLFPRMRTGQRGRKYLINTELLNEFTKQMCEMRY